MILQSGTDPVCEFLADEKTGQDAMCSQDSCSNRTPGWCRFCRPPPVVSNILSRRLTTSLVPNCTSVIVVQDCAGRIGDARAGDREFRVLSVLSNFLCLCPLSETQVVRVGGGPSAPPERANLGMIPSTGSAKQPL